MLFEKEGTLFEKKPIFAVRGRAERGLKEYYFAFLKAFLKGGVS